MQIISADERLRERRGAKILMLGQAGIGKTSQLKKLDVSRTLFVDIEAGDLAVLDLPVATVRLDDWPTARDLACRIGGPNKRSADNVLLAGALRGDRWSAAGSRSLRHHFRR
jgi:hypothetical protein